jgi:manganese/zinc/iron transport system substrate-binding protein
MTQIKNIIGLVALLASLAGCRPQNASTSIPTVVATTNILGDAAKVLLEGVDSVKVLTLMGPGVDPHLYKASQGDIESLTSAKIIVYNGLHLEGKMQKILENSQGVTLFAAGEALDTNQLINATQYGGAYDPHIWMDPTLWKQVLESLSLTLIQEFPKYKTQIAKNEQAYQKKLDILQTNSLLLLDNIPEKQRVLVTAHDAFKYFGRAYNLRVEGLQGISTTAEYGIKDIRNLVDIIAKSEIKAIFIESSVPKRSIEAVLAACEKRGLKVTLGGQLYSDALGGADSDADTYLKMFQSNVNTIMEALQ